MKTPVVYIMANKKNGTLYVGVSSDIGKRIWEHKNEIYAGFTKKYGIKTLVYYELCDDMMQAIEREKQLKAGNRKKKIECIEKQNPYWNDLYDEVIMP